MLKHKLWLLRLKSAVQPSQRLLVQAHENRTQSRTFSTDKRAGRGWQVISELIPEIPAVFRKQRPGRSFLQNTAARR